MIRAFAVVITLVLLGSCGSQQDISESEARKISAEFAENKFKGTSFTASAARPYDTGTAWVMNYYLPIKQHGGLVTVIVHKKTGEVMVAYDAEDSKPTLTEASGNVISPVERQRPE